MNNVVAELRVAIPSAIIETRNNVEEITQVCARAADEIERLEAANKEAGYYLYNNSEAMGGGYKGFATGRLLKRSGRNIPIIETTTEYAFAKLFKTRKEVRDFHKKAKHSCIIFQRIPDENF